MWEKSERNWSCKVCAHRKESKMKNLQFFIKWYVYITTGILIVCAVNFTLETDAPIPGSTLWKILLSGLLTTFVTVILLPKESTTSLRFFLRMFLHYAALCLVMVICGKWFHWLQYTPSGIGKMTLSVAAVYGLTAGTYYLLEVKQANAINQKLKERYSADDPDQPESFSKE